MFTLEQCSEKLNTLENEQASLDGQIKLLTTQVEEATKTIEKNKRNYDNYKKAVEVLDIVQQTIRKTIKDGFETVVTNALQSVFGKGFSLELEFGRRGNLQEVKFNISTPKCKKFVDPRDTSAGGEMDVISLALRSVVLELYQRKDKATLILDEPFKFVSPERVEAAGAFLRALSVKMNRQIIMVTHKKQLTVLANNVIKIGEK